MGNFRHIVKGEKLPMLHYWQLSWVAAWREQPVSVKEQGHKSTMELRETYCAVITSVIKMLRGNERVDLFVCLMLNSVSLQKPHKNDTQLLSLASNKDIYFLWNVSSVLSSEWHTLETISTCNYNLLYQLFYTIIKRQPIFDVLFKTLTFKISFYFSVNFYSVEFNSTILNMEENRKQIQKTPTHNEMFLVLKQSVITQVLTTFPIFHTCTLKQINAFLKSLTL